MVLSRMTVQAIDYHTAGEPFRIIAGGVGPIAGTTMLNKRRYAMEHLDHVRRLVINEPRGHADMYGCFVTDPVSSDGDLGVLFFHNAGFSTACGHGTIAIVTAAIETGMLPRLAVSAPAAGEQRVVVDAPSGRLEAVARVAETGRVSGVRFRNVPAYVETAHLPVESDRLGRLNVAIAYGGAFYALVDARQVGLRIEPAALPAFVVHGRAIKAAIESVHLPIHPVYRDIAGIYGVVFSEPAVPERAMQAGSTRHDVNVTIFADGEVDRSPCGSGTSARLAALYAEGELAVGQPLLHESIIGSHFTGAVVGQASVAGYEAVITEMEGSAYLTGYHTFVLEPDDPLGTGFLLRR